MKTADLLQAGTLLRDRDFGLFTLTRMLTGMAAQMVTVGVGWLVYDLSQSALALAFVGLVAFLPNILFALLAGQVADTFDRRVVIGTMYTLNALAALTITFVLQVSGASIVLVYVLVFLFGTARAFANPASQAMIPALVARENLSRAMVLSTSVRQLGTIVGPAIGGVLYGFGAPAAFGAAALLYIIAVAALCLMQFRPAPGSLPSRAIRWETLTAGIGFIRSRPVLLGAISLDLFAVLLGGATALLPIFAQHVFHVGPEYLGLMRTMPAVGAILSSLVLTAVPVQRRAGPRLFQAVAAFGVFTIAFALSPTVYWALLFLGLLGAADMVSVFIRNTLEQADTPDAMRGRVAAVSSVFVGASNELGEFESGLAAAALGPIGAVLLGGFGTLAVAGLWAACFPALRQRDHLLDEVEQPPDSRGLTSPGQQAT